MVFEQGVCDFYRATPPVIRVPFLRTALTSRLIRQASRVIENFFFFCRIPMGRMTQDITAKKDIDLNLK